MSLGTNLRRLRTAANLTQKQLAERAGISEISVRYYEADHHKPKMIALHKLATALNCDPNELLDLPINIPSVTPSDKSTLNALIEEYAKTTGREFSPEDIDSAVFIQYLECLGYSVAVYGYSNMLKYDMHPADENDFFVVIKGHGHTLSMHRNDFQEFQRNAGQIIQYEVYRQAQSSK